MRVRFLWLSLPLCCAAGRVTAQGDGARPAIAVINLRFNGERANVLEPGDTAVARAATSKLLATLHESAGVTVSDSGRVAAAVAGQVPDGGACDQACALAVGRGVGAQWVAQGTLIKTSNLVWVFSAELLEVGTGRRLLTDGYEIKGDPARMAPIGAHAFAQRITRAIGAIR